MRFGLWKEKKTIVQNYILNKFKERFDHSVAKDYLLGRYGAIPIFGIDDVDEEKGE